jgi:hypothetical protein
MNNMRKLAVFGWVALFMVSLGWLAYAEKGVSLSQVPPAVKAAIEKLAAGGAIEEIVQEMEEGQTIYEAVIVQNGKKTEYELSSAGELIDEEANENEAEEEEGEKEVKLSEVPEAVQAAFRKAVGANPIPKVEQETEDEVSTYEAEFEADGVKQSVKCASSGDVMELEKEINIQALPVAVIEGLREEYPQATLESAESVQVFFYEVELKENGKTFEVKVLASGDVEDDEREGEDGDDD